MSIIFRCDPPRLTQTAHLTTNTLSGLVGRNPGNLAFGYATALLLNTSESITFFEKIRENETIGVYACANLLGAHYDPSFFTNFLNQAPSNWRALLLGLGAQGPMNTLSDSVENISLNDKQLAWLDAVRERAPKGHPNIAVRGNFTYQLLQKYGYGNSAMVTGRKIFSNR